MICKIDGCENGGKITRGMCRRHYAQWRRAGDPLGTTRKPSPHWRRHFMYNAWAGMVNRCHNPNNSSYARYGGLGISVCDRWRHGNDGKIGFVCFLDDMGERPEKHTLDRIDPLGNYEPGNCRWATVETQRRNISSRGDATMRSAMSRGVKARWEAWRGENELRAELTRFQQKRLHALVIQATPVPSDGRKRKSLESLRSLGMAEIVDGAYRVTPVGVNWVKGGRAEKRWFENRCT